jgi:hypothetical protein
MLYSPLVTFCALNITFYQRTLLGTSANQKRHYLKSYNNIECLLLVLCLVVDVIIFPGTCYVLVFSIQLALSCARRNI